MKAELFKDNELLKKENIDMLHTIADLNNKLNALENEKASLLTITRLLQSELAENNTNYSPSTVQKVSYSKSNKKYCDVATKYLKIYRRSRMHLQPINFLYLIPKRYMMIKEYRHLQMKIVPFMKAREQKEKSQNLHANQLKRNNIVMRKIPKQKAVPVANLIKVEINEILKFAGTL